MRRLFNSSDGRLLDVAIDHGVFNEDRFLDGIEGAFSSAHSVPCQTEGSRLRRIMRCDLHLIFSTVSTVPWGIGILHAFDRSMRVLPLLFPCRYGRSPPKGGIG